MIGEEWIVVEPESSGFVSKLKSTLLGESGGLAGVGELMGGALVAGVGVALFEIGEKFQKARFQITRETGLTGKAMEEQFDGVKKVLSGVPSSLGDVTTAMDLLRQRTSLTKGPLDDLATQQLYLARITKTDVAANITTTTALFNKYGIAAADQGKKLDVIFKASQQAGVGVSTLEGLLSRGGFALQQYGFSFDQSTALIAQFSKVAGDSAPKALVALTSSFAKIAKAGGDPHAVLLKLIADLNGGKPKAIAMAEAMSLLGARGGGELVTAIQKGAFSLKGMLKIITDGKGGITETGVSTLSLGEKFGILKNRALVALEPIATKVVEMVDKGFDKVSEWFDKNGSKIGPALEKWKGPIIGVAVALGLLIAPFSTIAVGLVVLYTKSALFRQAIATVGDAIQTKLIPAVQAAARWITGTAIPALERFADFMRGTVWPVVQQVAGYIVGQFQNLVTAVQSRWNDIKQAISNVLMAIKIAVAVELAPILFVWKHFHTEIMAVLQAAWKLIKSTVSNALEVIRGVFDLVLGLLSGHWSRAWNGIKEILGGIWKTIVSVVEGGMSLLWAAVQIGLGLLESLWNNTFGRIVTFIGNWVSNVQKKVVGLAQWFSGLPGKIIAAVGNIGSQMFKIGKAIVDGIIQGLGDFAKTISDKIVGGVEGAVGGVLHTLHINSPSGVFRDIGHSIIEGLVMGVDEHAYKANASMARAAGGLGRATQVGYAGPRPGGRGGIGGSFVIQSLVLAPVFPPGMSEQEIMEEMKTLVTEELADALETVVDGGVVSTGSGR